MSTAKPYKDAHAEMKSTPFAISVILRSPLPKFNGRVMPRALTVR
jgi:hypothetical protein